MVLYTEKYENKKDFRTLNNNSWAAFEGSTDTVEELGNTFQLNKATVDRYLDLLTPS